MAVTLKICISDPTYIGKAKMGLRGDKLSCAVKYLFYIFQLFVCNFRKKYATSQTHFGFTSIGSNMHRSSATTILLLTTIKRSTL